MFRGFFGAYLLLRGDERRGLSMFDVSRRGVLLSFLSLFVVVPFYGLFFFQKDVSVLGVSLWYLLLLFLLIDAITWLIYPLAVRNIIVGFDRVSHFNLFVVARNWSRALNFFVYYVAYFIIPSYKDVKEADGPELLGLFFALSSFLILLFLLYYRWFVTKDICRAPAKKD